MLLVSHAGFAASSSFLQATNNKKSIKASKGERVLDMVSILVKFKGIQDLIYFSSKIIHSQHFLIDKIQGLLITNS